MIYTIGHKKTYLKAMRENDVPLLKTGRFPPSKSFPDGYPGGYAFFMKEDARRRIDEAYSDCEYASFGLLAKWNIDTELDIGGGWWHNLLINAEIVILDNSL